MEGVIKGGASVNTRSPGEAATDTSASLRETVGRRQMRVVGGLDHG